MEEETPLESPMVPLPASRDPADGCSFDFDIETEQALLDDLDWEEYTNPIDELVQIEFDSNLSSPTEWAHEWGPNPHDPTEWSSLQSPGRWTTAGEVFPVRQLGQLEINFDKNESLSGELQDAIKRLSTGIPRSSTTYSMNYRPIIKDTPDDEDENGKLSSQSDAYLVVEAEQIRVIEPVSRAIQETIKLSNIRVWAAHT